MSQFREGNYGSIVGLSLCALSLRPPLPFLRGGRGRIVPPLLGRDHTALCGGEVILVPGRRRTEEVSDPMFGKGYPKM